LREIEAVERLVRLKAPVKLFSTTLAARKRLWF
jgi:hypothetical protein